MNFLNWLANLKVGQKIGLGYTLALGIAVSGTVTGFVVGRYYYYQAEVAESHSHSELELLHRLQSRILQTRTHQQQLIPLLESPEDFQDEYAHMLVHQEEIAQLWSDLNKFIETSPHFSSHIHDNQILNFLETYDTVPQRYSRRIEEIVEDIQDVNLQDVTEFELSQRRLLTFTNSDLAINFDGISDDLVDLIDQVSQELDLAIQAKDQATVFIGRFIFVSIVLSVLIALSLAIITSRGITTPLQKLTSVAQQATTDANFDVQVKGIEQQDEIGLLADAFNSMIVSVRELLQEQEINNQQIKKYSRNLEQKITEVEQKTQEINDKNVQLQTLLEQLKHTQSQMVQSEKMSALGQMVAGIAHEINNPVNFIHGNLEHIQEYAENLLNLIQIHERHHLEPVPEIQHEAEEIDLEFVKTDLPKIISSMKLGTNRIREIILSLRTFSRIDESDLKSVDLHEGIESTLLILEHRLKAQPKHPEIQVIRDYGELPKVECYPSQLNQVFMNILVNAIDEIEAVYANLNQQEFPKKQIVIQTSRLDSDWIKISIADTGRGIPEASQQKIFDPFFTTKDVGKGTGMGMSISYQLITENHGGKLDFSSSPNQGTEFVIQIPIHQVK